jgi:cytochrome c oxidase assembly factor CtaG
LKSHDVTVTGYLVVLAAGVMLQLLSRRPGSRIPPLGSVITWAMGSRTLRVAILVGWAWLGLHFFAR